MKYLIPIKSHLFLFFKSFFQNLIMTMISLLLTFFLYKLIEWLINYHFENNFRKKRPLPVYINYNGNDIDFDIIDFDGYNYSIVVDVTKFIPFDGERVSSGQKNPIRHNIWMSKSDVSFFDIIKLFFRTFCNKHSFFQKIFKEKPKLSNSTKSNLIRILKNSQMIS